MSHRSTTSLFFHRKRPTWTLTDNLLCLAERQESIPQPDKVVVTQSPDDRAEYSEDRL